MSGIDCPAVELDTVSKKFCRKLRRGLWYGVGDIVAAGLGIRTRRDRLRTSEFWAVERMSLRVAPGEIVGLVGPNGSGKTTVLRMIAGIIPPDTGQITVRGRVNTLLALGAGFHPHMTVRENVFINGVLLGYSTAEIREHFDTILAHAGIGDFVDAPVAALSPGMRVRLGFSISVGLRPDVLLVDEVLSVGDRSFREQCIETIRTFALSAAVIFVSHNRATIDSLCTRIVELERPKIGLHC